MPPKVLSAVALMKKGARPSSSPSVGSRAERDLGQLFGLQHISVRRTEDMVAVLKSLALLFQHLEMPAGFPLLDVRLACSRSCQQPGSWRPDFGVVQCHPAGGEPCYSSICGLLADLSSRVARTASAHGLQGGQTLSAGPSNIALATILAERCGAVDLGHAAEDMLLNFVVVTALRSQQLAEYPVQNSHVHFSTPDVLPGLNRLALEAGSSRLGDASTSATACLSLGTLVDSILLPYWSKKETHVVYG